ncbi:hypothetical protein P691DRAFT_726361 [Macrolepiota fuliginosa MF-IS2]|uniref:NACHT domain-containing protein n=1 Tax=Macrolepiota fuliginosa MF-IS2 TaxID=1400762 RepID=A0A9P5XI90_9AGAR|nr:hypothetical protein P691DRAFT_726361 [Macrolepiota fuliginosa MF-IS2]
MRGNKKERRETIERGGSDLNIQTSSPGFSYEPLTSVISSPPTAGSSGNGTSNLNNYTGYLSGAHHFTINNPTMIDGDNANERESMRRLAKHIIVGAEFDSSDHHPSCHPETRLDISNNIQSWMHNLARKYKILWLNGPAGVGKSVILQTISETESKSSRSILGATLFFSRSNNRNDPKRVFITIAYQLAVRYPLYRQYVVGLLTLNPALVNKSLAEQFEIFIVQPFAVKELLAGLCDTVLVLLDGLDECKGEEAQREIILLIGNFALRHPTSPIIWLIASRSGPYIQDTFLEEGVQLSYEEMQVLIDSDQGRCDVEKYLRDNFTIIRKRHRRSIPSSLQRWPSESDFSTIATESSGLFIFPSTIIRFIGDEDYADPISRLKTVLEVILSTSSSYGGHNPFENLDALYTQILSEIPPEVLSTTLQILLMYVAYTYSTNGFAGFCNWLGVSQGHGYGALRRLHSVLKVPEPQNAFQEHLEYFHASFFDYLTSPSRSGTFCVTAPEIIQRHLLRWIRVLLESHSAETSSVNVTRINLSWPVENEECRLRIQYNIFRNSLNHLLRILDEFVNDSVLDEFSKLSAFFQDLDFGENFQTHAMADGLDLKLYQESAFSTSLEKWRVLETVPLRLFSYSDIRLDHEPVIRLVRGNFLDARAGWHRIPSEESVDSVSEGIFYHRIISLKSRTISIEPVRGYLSQDPTLKADLKKNLSTWTNMVPSHPVIMLGRGRRSCACFQFHVPGEGLWMLALPCIRSS